MILVQKILGNLIWIYLYIVSETCLFLLNLAQKPVSNNVSHNENQDRHWVWYLTQTQPKNHRRPKPKPKPIFQNPAQIHTQTHPKKTKKPKVVFVPVLHEPINERKACNPNITGKRQTRVTSKFYTFAVLNWLTDWPGSLRTSRENTYQIWLCFGFVNMSIII